jgi:hypothetical protein
MLLPLVKQGFLPGAAVNGFFVSSGDRTSCGTSVVMNAKPRDTSKPERGRWANPRAGRLKEVWDAVEEWLHTAGKRARVSRYGLAMLRISPPAVESG